MKKILNTIISIKIPSIVQITACIIAICLSVGAIYESKSSSGHPVESYIITESEGVEISPEQQAFKSALENEIRTVIIDDISNDTSDNSLAESIATSVTERIIKENIITVESKEELTNTVVESIAMGDAQISEAVAQSIADSVAEEVAEQILDDLEKVNLSDYATKSSLDSKTKQLEFLINNIASTASDNVSYKLSDADIKVIADKVIASGNIGLTEAQIKNIVADEISKTIVKSSLSDYTYTLTDADKSQIIASVNSGISNQLSTMSTELTTLRSDISTLQTQMATIQANGGGTVDLSTVNSSISDLQSRVNSLEIGISAVDLSTVNNNITALQSSVSSLQSSVSSLSSANTTEEGDITTLQGDVSTLSTSVGTLNTQVTNNATAISDLADDVSTLQTNVASAVSTLNSLDSVYASDSELNTARTALQGQIDTLTTSVSSIEGDINNIETSLTTTYATKSEVASQISTVQNSVTALSNTVSSLNGTYATDSELNSAVDGLQGQIDDINTDVGDIQNDVSDLDGRTSDLETRADGIDNDITDLQGQINNLDSTYATDTQVSSAISNATTTINGTISTLQTQVDGIDSDLTTLSDALDDYRNTVSTTYATITALNDALTRLETAEGNIETLTGDLSTLDTTTVKVSDFNTYKTSVTNEFNSVMDSLATSYSNWGGSHTVDEIIIYKGNNPSYWHNQILVCREAYTDSSPDFSANMPTADRGHWSIMKFSALVNSIKQTLDNKIAKAYGMIGSEFSTTSTYAVGDYVVKDGLLYRCTTAVSTPGVWSAGNWTATNIGDELSAINNDLTKLHIGRRENILLLEGDNSAFTARRNGLIYIEAYIPTTSQQHGAFYQVTVNDVLCHRGGTNLAVNANTPLSSGYMYDSCLLPLKEGDVVRIWNSLGNISYYGCFIE